MQSKFGRTVILGSWHLLVLVGILILPSQLTFGSSFWQAPDLNPLLLATIALLYLVSAIVLYFFADRSNTFLLSAISAIAVSAALICFSLILVQDLHFSRKVLLLSLFLMAVGLASPALPTITVREIAAIAVGVLLAGGLIAGWLSLTASNDAETSDRIVRASKHMLNVTTHKIAELPDRARGGALVFDDRANRYILSDGSGHMWELGWRGENLETKLLDLRVPVNRREFLRDKPAAVSAEDFRVADLLITQRNDTTFLYASHHFWREKEGCFVVRVSEVQFSATSDQEWRTVYESKPCLPFSSSRAISPFFVGEQIGGNLEIYDDERILLTLGDHQFDGWYKMPDYITDLASDYGKTLLVDTSTGDSSLFTIGHRNPQGLTKSRSGLFWETEHGPRGGDELNLLVEGSDYGYPRHTYGTEYNSVSWPLSDEADEASSEKPIFAWIPSIAISDLIEIDDSGFPRWDGNLLIGSLVSESLWRVHLEGTRVVYTEQIEIGARIRDIATSKQREILLYTDAHEILRVQPAGELNDGASLFTLHCGGCHHAKDIQLGIGPSLAGVINQKVAAAKGYSYSPALEKLGGRWTENRIDEFLANPAEFSPGTTMAMEPIEDAQVRAAIIEYLKWNPWNPR